VARLVFDLSDEANPRYEVRGGDKPGETLIVLGAAEPRALPTPMVRREGDCLLLRVAGAGELKRSVGVLNSPHRVYADLEGATTQWYEAQSAAAPLAAIRMGQQEPKDGRPVARIVLELRQKQAHAVFADSGDLVIAVGPHSWALPLPKYAAAGRLKGRTLVVDPGHGGDDIGAPAGSGSPPSEPYEKNVTLTIARRLAALLKAEGASVTMTREDDTFVSLPERAAIANRLKADALVSIHCNSCERPNTLCGTSVYYDHPHSAQFAALVQSELIAALGTADKGVRNANFAVIRRTTGPGVLVETAFINHDEDRQRLLDPNSQERTARAITQGLIEYLETQPQQKEAAE
jgi:N-acetylmuramoyl-L-alanine amidase